MGNLCQMAAVILACYHPTAIPRDCAITSYDTAEIGFQGGLTRRPYAMTVRGESNGNMRRVVLITDNAIVPPNANCPLANWQPAD